MVSLWFYYRDSSLLLLTMRVTMRVRIDTDGSNSHDSVNMTIITGIITINTDCEYEQEQG